MQNVPFLNIVTPFFNTYCVAAYEPSDSICKEGLALVIKVVYALQP